MTISTTTARVRYEGDGSTTVFPVPFKFFDNGHVKARLRLADGTEILWTEDSEYLLTGAGVASGGTLTVRLEPDDFTPQLGEVLVIELQLPFTQQKAFPLGGAFPSSQVEEGFDLAVQRAIQLAEFNERLLRVPATDARLGSELELPVETERAGSFLAFDLEGRPIAAAGTSGDLGPVSAFAATLLDDDDATAARATLGAAASGKSQTLSVPGIHVFRLRSELKSDGDFPIEVFLGARNDLDQNQDYVNLSAGIVDNTAGTEDGRFDINTVQDGAIGRVARFEKGVQVGTPIGGDRGFESINATAYFGSGAFLLPNFIGGLGLSISGADPEHDIVIAPGSAADSMNVEMLPASAAATIAIDTTADRVDGSSLDPDSWYHVLIGREGNAYRHGFSKVIALPSGWHSFRRIGSVLTDSAGNIRPFTMLRDRVLWSVPEEDVSATPTTVAALHDLTVPPGIQVEAFIAPIWRSTSPGVRYGLITSPDQADTAPSVMLANCYSVVGIEGGNPLRDVQCPVTEVRTNDAGQIRSRFTAANGTLTIVTQGWRETER